MRIKAFRNIGDRHPLFAEDIMVVLVEMDDGTPAVVACQHEPRGGLDGVTLAHANEKDFNTILSNLGFKQLTICTDLGSMKKSPAELEHMPSLLYR